MTKIIFANIIYHYLNSLISHLFRESYFYFRDLQYLTNDSIERLCRGRRYYCNTFIYQIFGNENFNVCLNNSI